MTVVGERMRTGVEVMMDRSEGRIPSYQAAGFEMFQIIRDWTEAQRMRGLRWNKVVML